MNNQKIGVFDSGVGGLTCLKLLQKELPHENFIFIGDNAHSPYGEKTYEQLLSYTTAIINYFIKEGCKMVVLACNTTSCVVLPTLQKLYPNLPLIGVVESTINAYKQNPSTKVCIMATNATINSNAYQSKIGEDVCIGLACPKLVPLVENDASSHEKIEALKELLDQPMKTCDGIILGCTHYPILMKEINQLYPNVKIYSSSDAISKDVLIYLQEHDMLSNQKMKKDIVCTTGDLSAFYQSASSFFDFSQVYFDHLDME